MPSKILVVDDEQGFLEIIEGRLKAAGYEVRTATNGEDAMKLIREDKPGLIIADLTMPGMNGFELSRVVKTDPNFKNIPMILLSGLVQEDSEAEGLQKGDFYMAKPLDFKRLSAKIKDFLGEDPA